MIAKAIITIFKTSQTKFSAYLIPEIFNFSSFIAFSIADLLIRMQIKKGGSNIGISPSPSLFDELISILPCLELSILQLSPVVL